MRLQIATVVLLTFALIGIAAYAAFPPTHCAAPSARSVESLFAPCLEQQAYNPANVPAAN